MKGEKKKRKKKITQREELVGMKRNNILTAVIRKINTSFLKQNSGKIEKSRENDERRKKEEEGRVR
jgi:hypothetical protein